MSLTIVEAGLPLQDSCTPEQAQANEIVDSMRRLSQFLPPNQQLVQYVAQLSRAVEDLTQRITSLEKKLTSPGASGSAD